MSTFIQQRKEHRNKPLVLCDSSAIECINITLTPEQQNDDPIGIYTIYGLPLTRVNVRIVGELFAFNHTLQTCSDTELTSQVRGVLSKVSPISHHVFWVQDSKGKVGVKVPHRTDSLTHKCSTCSLLQVLNSNVGKRPNDSGYIPMIASVTGIIELASDMSCNKTLRFISVDKHAEHSIRIVSTERSAITQSDHACRLSQQKVHFEKDAQLVQYLATGSFNSSLLDGNMTSASSSDYPNLTDPLHLQTMRTLKELAREYNTEHVPISAINEKMNEYEPQTLQCAIDFLLAEGYMYTTIDDQHVLPMS